MSSRKQKTYKSSIFEAVHEAMSDAYEVGVIDKTTMREFDAMCLTKVDDLSPRDIKRIRRREGVSQAVFAHFLNVTPNLVSQWERGGRRPSGTSLKLLALVKAKGLDAIA
jgi:putative transcriptional regulator